MAAEGAATGLGVEDWADGMGSGCRGGNTGTGLVAAPAGDCAARAGRGGAAVLVVGAGTGPVDDSFC